MSQIKKRTLSSLKFNEPPDKRLISEADHYIKRLSHKQTDTRATLQKELTYSQEFVKSAKLISPTDHVCGTASLQDFQKCVQHSKHVEYLSSCGLSEQDVKFYLDSLKGEDYLIKNHKNLDISVFQRRLDEINSSIKVYELKRQNDMLLNTSPITIEHGLSVKPNSIETKLLKFALNNEKAKKNASHPLHPQHPLNHISEITEHRFADILEEKSPNVNKIRGKCRKLHNRLNKLTCTQIGNTCASNSTSFQINRSKWDVTKNVEQVISSEKKFFSCAQRTYYTINDGQIVKLTDKHVPQTIKFGSKLTVEQIRQLPKFKNYQAGNVSEVLYLKNLSNSLKMNDLKELFRNYELRCPIDYRLLSGRMKGQAFVTFKDKEIAALALDEVNGRLINNKPAIITFGNKKIKDT